MGARTGVSFIPTSLLPPLTLWASVGKDLWRLQMLSWIQGRRNKQTPMVRKVTCGFYCLFSISFDNCSKVVHFVTVSSRVTGTHAELTYWHPEVQLCTAVALASLLCAQGSHTNSGSKTHVQNVEGITSDPTRTTLLLFIAPFLSFLFTAHHLCKQSILSLCGKMGFCS